MTDQQTEQVTQGSNHAITVASLAVMAASVLTILAIRLPEWAADVTLVGVLPFAWIAALGFVAVALDANDALRKP